MNSIYQNEIIFATTNDNAELYLRKLLCQIEQDGDEVIKQVTKDKVKTDKRVIKAIRAGMNGKGYRCSIAHVDDNLPIWVLHEVIIPTMNTVSYVDDELPIRDRIKYFRGRTK